MYLKHECTICPHILVILVVQLSLLITMDKLASWQTHVYLFSSYIITGHMHLCCIRIHAYASIGLA